jgi:flagellar assembly protein FliH
MSSRARRIVGATEVESFDWSGQQPSAVRVQPLFAETGPRAVPSAPPPQAQPSVEQSLVLDAAQKDRLAALEREAFAKGYQQGERAGAEAGAKRAEAMLRRLAETLEELGEVRRTMVRHTERQMVQLALAIAKRVVRREVAIDQDLTLTLARVALDRLGDSMSVTIRLHPDDYQATVGRHDDHFGGSHVTVVADAAVSRGGCRVDSDFGYVDASVDAQFQELARALLVEEGQEAPVANGDR